jgi:hypothetical protein
MVHSLNFSIVGRQTVAGLISATMLATSCGYKKIPTVDVQMYICRLSDTN